MCKYPKALGSRNCRPHAPTSSGHRRQEEHGDWDFFGLSCPVLLPILRYLRMIFDNLKGDASADNVGGFLTLGTLVLKFQVGNGLPKRNDPQKADTKRDFLPVPSNQVLLQMENHEERVLSLVKPKTFFV